MLLVTVIRAYYIVDVLIKKHYDSSTISNEWRILTAT